MTVAHAVLGFEPSDPLHVLDALARWEQIQPHMNFGSVTIGGPNSQGLHRKQVPSPGWKRPITPTSDSQDQYLHWIEL